MLRRTCFVKESQTYPDLSVRRVLASARLLQPGWDEGLAQALVTDFDLPLNDGCASCPAGCARHSASSSAWPRALR